MTTPNPTDYICEMLAGAHGEITRDAAREAVGNAWTAGGIRPLAVLGDIERIIVEKVETALIIGEFADPAKKAEARARVARYYEQNPR